MYALRRLAHSVAPRLETLEERATPATFTVDNLDDSGPGSLRQAIVDLRDSSDAENVIQFMAGLAGTVELASSLPIVANPVDIQGPGSKSVIIDGGEAHAIFRIDDSEASPATVTISSLVLRNGRNEDGGAIFNQNENVILTNMEIRANRASDRGGAVASNGGQVTIRDSLLEGNVSEGEGGGGIAILQGNLNMRDSVIRGNVAAGNGDGGGILHIDPAGNTNLGNILFADNQALDDFGGGLRADGGNVDIVNSAFVTNNANFGGGVHTANTTLTIRNSTFSGNTATDSGGGVRIVDQTTLTISNSTLTLNVANQDNQSSGFGGGLSIANSATATLQSTIVADNRTGTPVGTLDDIEGTVEAISSHNLVGVDTNLIGISNGVNDNQIGEAQNPIDPLLGPLLRNGGRTPTHALLQGSPAIDAGDPDQDPNNEQSDQRGIPFVRRFGDTVDIGAFEVQDPITLVVTTLEDQNDLSFVAADLSLREALELTGTGVQSINFAPGLSGGTLTLTLGELDIKGAATLNGPGAKALTIDGVNLTRIFQVDDDGPSSLVDVTISGLTLTNGMAEMGGAIQNQENLTLRGVHVTASRATEDGGGIVTERGTLNLCDSAVTNNHAEVNGGGIAVLDQATLEVSNSTISNNAADNDGGGIYQSGGATAVMVRNSTIAFNQADQDGMSGGSGGGIFRSSGTSNIFSSIIAENLVGASGEHPDLSGTLEVDFSLVQDTTGSNLVDSADNLLGLDPFLEALTNNGGSTPTHALDPLSPAVDAGSNPDDLTNDQRGPGFPRVIGTTADIGAVEVMQNIPSIQVTVEQSPGQPDPTNSLPLSFVVTFSESVTGFEDSDLVVTSPGNTPTVMLIGQGAMYLVQISNLTVAGEVSLQVPAGVVSGSEGVTNSASTSNDNRIVYDPELTDEGPTVLIDQASGQVDPTDQQPIRFTVTFSEAVTGLEVSDLDVDSPGNTPTIELTGSGTTYTVEVSGLEVDGLVTLRIPAGVAMDSDGNVNAESLPFSEGSDRVDFRSGPDVTVEQAPQQSDPTSFQPLRFVVTFSEPVTGFTASDVILMSPGNTPAVTIVGDGANYTIEIANLTVGTTVTVSIPAGAAIDSDGNPNAASTSTDNSITFEPKPVGQNTISEIAVGASFGGPNQVVVYDAMIDPTERYRIDVDLPGFSGGLRTAQADVTGDGTPDVIVGTGPGVTNQVLVFDGTTQSLISSFSPFETSFSGGLFVTAGDLNNDGVAEIIITPDQSGGPVVAVYNDNGEDFVELTRFFGIEDPNFRGGARVGVGDINGDGISDLAVAAGFGGGPRMALFDGQRVLNNETETKIVPDFFVFEQSLRDGAYVAVGDLNGDGFGDLYLGGGPQGGPRVRVFSGAFLITGNFDTNDPGLTQDVQLANFFGDDPNSRSGIRVAAKDLNNDRQDDLLVGQAEGRGSLVIGYDAASTPLNDTPPDELFNETVFGDVPGFPGGVFIG